MEHEDLTDPAIVDYFASDERYRVWLPDGKQWVECKSLTEGDRRRYQNKVNKEVRLNRVTGDAHMALSSGDERAALLEAAIVDWHLIKGGAPLPFTRSSIGNTLEKLPPKIVDLIEKAVRKNEPWLMQDLSVEDIQKQIDELEEMKRVKQKEEEGNAS